MKKIISWAVFAAMLNVSLLSGASLIVNAEDDTVSTSVVQTDSTDALENAYLLLKQFVTEQKESGNYAFSLAGVYTSSELFGLFEGNSVDEIPVEYRDKVFLEYFWGEEEAFLTSVKAFMQENGIDENLVAYTVLEDAVETDSTDALENAYLLLKQFVTEQFESGNYAFSQTDVYTTFELFEGNSMDEIPVEFQNKVIVDCPDPYKEEVIAAVKAFMQENGIDENLVTYIFKAIALDVLRNTQEALEQFVAEQKANGNYAFSMANVYDDFEFFGGSEVPEEFQNKVILEYYWSDEEAFLTAVKAFMQENGIDENLVAYIALEDAVEVETPALGDINNDSKISVIDVLSLNRNLIGIDTLSKSQQEAADVNQDGVADATDSLNILKYVVQLIDDFDSLAE